MESRIKQLRENRGLIQEILASELGITQQMHFALFGGRKCVLERSLCGA